jgi:hypothetical protein
MIRARSLLYAAITPHHNARTERPGFCSAGGVLKMQPSGSCLAERHNNLFCLGKIE